MKTFVLTFAFLLLSGLSFSQDCDCPATYRWVKETFETNDAGFAYALEQKGQEAYEVNNMNVEKKANQIKSDAQCAELLFDWLTFFRTGHIWFGLHTHDGDADNQETDAEIIQKFEKWERYNYKPKQFANYINNLKNPGFEGIWSSEPYKIGIVAAGEEYIGFIIEGDGVYWREGQVKLILKEGDNGMLSTYYMRDHSSKKFEDIKFLDANHLKIGFVYLERLAPEGLAGNASSEHYFRSLNARKPYMERLSDETILLRIPSFDYSQGKLIENLIDSNRTEILNTKNLIIDLRGNGGGSDNSYMSILPYIYTNPIRTVGVELLSTPLNNSRMEEFMDDPEWSDEERQWAAESLEKLEQHPGEFVNLDSTVISTDHFDTVFPFPKNVGIIINETNGSTTEQFLLAAKQSKKVKLFGTTTRGVLDISNMHSAVSPCGNFELGYCLSRSLRIPEMTIDGKGIQPDYYIHSSTPPAEWLPFVEQTLSAH